MNSLGSGYAEVTVRANPPPKFAVLSSVPSSGVSLNTEFQLTVTGALDSAVETPLLYQFGVVLRDRLAGTSYSTQQGDLAIQWLSPPQVLPSLRTVLHSGEAMDNFTVQVIARVFDRNGGQSDVFANVTSYELVNATTEFFIDGISRIKKSLNSSKDWSNALTELSIYSIEINKYSSQVDLSVVKEAALQVFLDVFDNYLPLSSNHFPVATSVLSSLIVNFTSPSNNLKRMISARLKDISSWYRRETALSSAFHFIPIQDSNEPEELQGSYLSPEREALTLPDATLLLFPWTQLLDDSNSDPIVQSDFLEAIESVSNVLCQQASIGEQPSFIILPSVVLHTVISTPTGLFNASGHAINFRSSVSDVYQSQACRSTGLACTETCFVATTFLNGTNNAAATQSIALETKSLEKIVTEIEGSDPSKLELVSSIVSVSIHIPSEQSYLNIRNLNSYIDVLIPVTPNSAENGSVLLCLYRELGGDIGFQNLEWKLDNTTSPTILNDGSSEYYLCRFNHLTDFAIARIPPPMITVPSTTPPPATPPPTTMEPTTTEEITMAASIPLPSTGSPVPAIVAVIVVLLAVGVLIVVLVVLFIVWRQKKKKKLKIAPDESQKVEPEPVELVQAGPLTPAESKILMDIIQCIEEGKRTRLGKLNVLPSIRLRELRNEIIENFPALKNKPFYFLTRQLCDIEPTTEQQQFVSIVYGDKPIFIREVVSESIITKKHFCVCGNAALLECSNCSSQGYCSQECQNKHWVEKHQKECGRLSERKRRADVLYNRQSTVVSPAWGTLSPISEAASPRASVGAAPLSTSAATSDWKSFMQQRKVSAIDAQRPSSQFPPPVRSRTLSVPSGNVTTLGGLSRQISLPQPDQSQVVSQAQPVASTSLNQTTLRPLQKVPLAGNYGSNQPHSDHPSISRMTSVVGSLAPISPQRTQSLSHPPGQGLPSAPLAAPQQQPLFIRKQLPQESTRPPQPVRHLSIQSLGSPVALSPDIRNNPLLEAPNEDDARRSQDGSSSRLSSDSRPPVLAVRKKRENRQQSASSDDLSSSSDDYDSSSDSSSDNSKV